MEKKYEDLALDLNLDQATSEEAWKCYSSMLSSYTLEGDQMHWIACALYTASRKRSVPTVGGRPGNFIEGNCVSLTRMLQCCNLPLVEFISKMKLWLAMSHYEEEFCRRIDLLERNFAVSNNIFKKYKPIFLELFQNPANDSPRPPRSRKLRRPPCNATELFHFCWTLYVLIKGKYPCIPQDLVSCYCLLLAAVDLIYANVLSSNRRDLLNMDSAVLTPEVLRSDIDDSPVLCNFSIMDYLCKNFDGVLVDTKVVREYYWMPNIKDLISTELLKGTPEGMALIDQVNFDKNVKDVKNAYEEHLLNCGEFDERMFLNDDIMVKASMKGFSPKLFQSNSISSLSSPASISSTKIAVPSIVYEGDHHLIQQTPITGKRYTINRPVIGNTPITIVTSGLQKLYALISGRTNSPSEKLIQAFCHKNNNPLDGVYNIIEKLSKSFEKFYSQSTDEYTCPNKEFVKMRLQMIQILFYTFLEHILDDEKRKGIELQAILKEDMFHKTLFTLCIEIVLKSYTDARKFPWSLQVGNVAPYYFVRIIEIVIRSEKQNENQLPREIVKHFKSIEEQILDSLAWKTNSPLWEAIKKDPRCVPSQCEVQLTFPSEESTSNNNNHPLISAVKPNRDQTLSPVSSITDSFLSPGTQARRMLFPPDKPSTCQQIEELKAPVNFDKYTQSKHLSTQQKVNCNGAANNGTQNGEHKDKPKRQGSMALFFRKFYTLAFLRLNDLMDRLDVTEACLRQTVWTVFEHSIINHVVMLEDRHMDQLVMCAIYITCKVTDQNKIFQEIMKHYRSQPQASSHIYRSVLISKSGSADLENQQKRNGPPPKPNEVTGSFIKMPSGVRGDLIKFYNFVYVQNMKSFTLKFCPTKEISKPVLSPLPQLKCTLASPRSRVSRNHSVFISSQALNQTRSSPQAPTTKRPLYFFNRSPAKDLEVINSLVKVQINSAKRQLSDITSFVEVKSPRIEAGPSHATTRRIQFHGNDTPAMPPAAISQQLDEIKKSTAGGDIS